MRLVESYYFLENPKKKEAHKSHTARGVCLNRFYIESSENVKQFYYIFF
jgi:hypothetical protein